MESRKTHNYLEGERLQRAVNPRKKRVHKESHKIVGSVSWINQSFNTGN